MKADRQQRLPPPMTDEQLVYTRVQEAARKGALNEEYWDDLIPDIALMFGVGILEANHIARRHLNLCWMVSL